MVKNYFWAILTIATLSTCDYVNNSSCIGTFLIKEKFIYFEDEINEELHIKTSKNCKFTLKHIHSKDNQLSLKVPLNWQVQNKKDLPLYLSLRKSSDEYFCMLVHDKLNFTSYLHETEDLLNNSHVKNISSEILKLNDKMISKKIVESIHNEISYIGYICSIEKEDQIFEFTLKQKKGTEEPCSEILFYQIIRIRL